jgi:hypothetical protein
MVLSKRVLVSLIISTVASLGAIAQNTSSVYTDTTGRLFVKQGTPIFLYLSTSPDGRDAIKLQSIENGGEPMHWNGHGFHSLAHTNLYLGRNIRFDIFVDGTAPKTSTGFDITKGFQKGNIIYLSGTTAIELKAVDENSGVSSKFYAINKSPFQLYTQPLLFDKEGEFTIQFYSVDNVGNKEDEGERTIIIDTTPPVTTLEIQGPHHNEVIAQRTRFTLSATDANGVSHTMYSINNGNEFKYTSPISLAHLPEGEHIINWYSTDNVGNIETKNTFNFFVDKTPPMVFEEIMGNTYMVAGREFSSGRSQLRIVAVDNKAGVKEIYYSINNAPFLLYEKPIFLSDITGAVTVRSYAIDNVDNKGTSDSKGQQFSMPEVDITGPIIKHAYIGNRLVLRDTLWISPRTQVSITATDRGSGVNRISYKINNNSIETYTKPFEVTESGFHMVTATAWDNVENLNISNFEFGVDTKAPEIFHNFSVKPHRFVVEDEETIPVFSGGVYLYIAATDNIVGVDKIMISHNDAREKSYTQPLNGFKANQTHTIKIHAIDRLGNEEVKIVKFKVD